MPIISYAQNREDVLLHRALRQPTGIYLDIGAADPTELSVTRFFYERGWNGINVEPQDHYFRKLMLERPRDINLQIVVSDVAGSLTFYEMPDRPGWASVDAGTVERLRAEGVACEPRTVRTMTLTEVCERYVTTPIDFLKVDVEGHERAVLVGGDFQRFRPRIVVVEATEVGKPDLNHDRWEDVILSRDYLYSTFDGLNRYYVRAEDRELIASMQVPVNVHDEFQPYEWLRPYLGALEHANHLEQEVKGLRERIAQLEGEIAESREEASRMERAYEAAIRMRDEVRAHLESLRSQMLRTEATE